MNDNDDFRQLSSLSELIQEPDEDRDAEPERDFHAPVAHTKNTNLKTQEQNSIDDYNYVRKVHLNLIESGQISIEVAINELRASGHPRAAEVVGGLIKQLADVSGQLLDINKNAVGPTAPENQTNIQNNFYGSPDDLLKQIEKEEKEREKEDPPEGFEVAEVEEESKTD